jgi:DNA-binding NarL/FixJ family response regulator
MLPTALRRIDAADTAALAGIRTARSEPIDYLNAEGVLAMARLPPVAPALASLSDAERAIVECIPGGTPIAAIACERGTSPRTVTYQIASTYQKLGVSSRRELLALLI